MPRKVDASLYKEIMLKAADSYGWDKSEITDDYINSVYERTGGDVKRYLTGIYKQGGTDLKHLTDDSINELLDSYGVVDKINTPKTSSFMKIDEALEGVPNKVTDVRVEDFYVPEDKGTKEDIKFSVSSAVDSIDEYYNGNGDLTPVQKEAIANRRFGNAYREIVEKYGNTSQAANRINEEANRIINDLHVVYQDGRFVANDADRKAYDMYLTAAMVNPKDYNKVFRRDEVVKSRVDVAKELNDEFERNYYKPSSGITGGEPLRVAPGSEITMASGLLYESGVNEAPRLFNDATIQLYKVLEQAKRDNTVVNFAKGAGKGFWDHFADMVTEMQDFGRNAAATNLNRKIVSIEEGLRRERPFGEVPPEVESYGSLEDYMAALRKYESEQKRYNDEISFAAYQELTPREQNLINSAANYYGAVQDVSKEIPGARSAGEVFGGSLGYMVEFMGTGGSGWIKGAAKAGLSGLAKAAAKRGAKSLARGLAGAGERIAVEAGEQVARNLPQKVAGWVKEKPWQAAEAAVQSVMMPSFYKEVGDRISQGERPADAFVGSLYDTWTENFSERFFVGGGKYGRLTGSAIDWGKTKGLKGAARLAGNNLEEYGEELVGDFLKRLPEWADKNWTQAYGDYWDDKWDTFVNISLMTGVLGGAAEISNSGPVNKLRYKWNADIYRKAVPEMLANNIDELIESGDISSQEASETIGNLVEASSRANHIPIGKLTGDVVRYVSARQKQKGFELFTNSAENTEKSINLAENISDNGIRNDNRGIQTESSGGISEVGIQREGGEGGRRRTEGYSDTQPNRLRGTAAEFGKSDFSHGLSEDIERSIAENTYLQRPKKSNGRPLYEPTKLREADVDEFVEATKAGKLSNPHGAFVDIHSPEEYKKMRIRLLSEDGKSGIAVEEDGNIVNLFSSNSSTNGASTALFLAALDGGGIKGDNFGLNLTERYTQMGAVPVARVKFNDEFAPDGWNYERDGRPDIIFWMHNGESASDVAKKIGSYEEMDVSQLPLFDSYEEARAYRDKLLEERRSPQEKEKRHKSENKNGTEDDLKKRLDSIVGDYVENERNEIRKKEEENSGRELEEIRWNISRKGIIVDVDGRRVRVSRTKKGGYNTKNEGAIAAFEQELDKRVEQEKPRVSAAMEKRITDYNGVIDEGARDFRRKLEEGNVARKPSLDAKVQDGGISLNQATEMKRKVKEAYNRGKGEVTDRINAVRSALSAYRHVGQLSDSQYKNILKKLSRKNADVDGILDNIDRMVVDNAFRERAYAAKVKQQKQADVIRKKISKMMLPDWLGDDVMERFITLDTDSMNAQVLGQYEKMMADLARPRPRFSRFIPDFIDKYNENGVEDAAPKRSEIEVDLERLQERIRRVASRMGRGGEALFRSLEDTTSEEQDIIDRAKKDGSYMKARNGDPSNLNEKQWAQVRSKAFKEWFGDWENDPENASKVVDENGDPIVVYHGTLKRGLTEFNKDFIGSRFSYDEKGFFFISNDKIAKDYARSEFDSSREGEVIPAFVSLKNPLIADAKWGKKNGLGAHVFNNNDVIEFWDNYQSLLIEESANNDGVIINDGKDLMVVAFEPGQIKSATDNAGTFSKENNDIRFRDIEDINARFNGELEQQVEGKLPKGHVYQLGRPGNVLQRAGIPDLPIELSSSRLSQKSSGDYKSNHPFDLSEVRNLPEAIQNPIAVFDSKTRAGSKVIMTELTDSKGNHFVVAMSTNVPKGRYGTRSIQINDIRSVYPKDNVRDIVNWINRGDLLKWAEKTKLGNWLTQQRSNSAEVAIPVSELDVAANIIKNHNNPTLLEGEISSAIDELSDELGVKVNKVKIRKDLPEGVQRQMKGGRYPGLFDPKTGEVYMVMDEITDVSDAQATMLHEIVGHKGVRGLFGNRIGEFAQRVLDSIPEGEREAWVKKYDGNEQLAAEEYVARFAEGYENPGVWERIKAIIRELFRDLGIELRLSDNDLKYVLWKAKKGVRKEKNALDSVKDSVKNVENALFRDELGTEKSIGTIEEYRNVNREVSRLKNMASRWYGEELGKIEEDSDGYEERVKAVGDSYERLLDDIEGVQERLKDVSGELKKELIDGISGKDGSGMLAEAMEAQGVKGSPFEEVLQEIKRFGVGLKGFEHLELKDLVNLETALFNASIGVPTRDLFTVWSRLKANEMGKRLIVSRDKIERAGENKRVRRLLDNLEKLKDVVDMHDFSMVDAIFDAGSGKDLYENFFVPQIERAVVRMDKEKALVLREFGEAMQKLEDFFVLSRLSAGTPLKRLTRGEVQRYRDLAGMVMTQLDYESNVPVPFEELPDELKDYFGNVIGKANVPKDLRNRTKAAYQFMRFGEDGRLDVEKTLETVKDKELAGILKEVMGVARRTLDGSMKQYSIANAVRRGVNIKMMDNYFPRFVRKALAAKTDGEIDFQNIYASGRLMPTTLPGSMNKRVTKAMPNPVEIDIARVMRRAADETLTDYFLAPAFAQANSALTGIQKDGGKAAGAFEVLRGAMRDRLIKNYRREISKDDTRWEKDVDRAVAKMARTLLLAKVPKTVAEFASNQAGSIISDGTAGWSYWGKIDVLHELADAMNLTSAKNIVKYNEMYRDATGGKMSLGEKGVNKLITINDEWTSSAIYYKTFNKLFEEYSGQKFDYEKAQTDEEYRRWVIEDQGGERSYFERAHIGALTRAQESFTTVNRALGATHTRFLPGIGKRDVDSFRGRAFGFMMSFNTNERFEFVRGAREFGTGIRTGNKQLLRDGLGRMASRFVRGAVYAGFMQQIGSLIASGFRDDKDPEWSVNPNLLAGTCIQLALGRYGNTGGMLLNLGLGALKWWDKKVNGNTELTKSVVSAINDGAGIYAVPLSTDMPTLRTIEKFFPHWGFMMRVVTDSPEMAYDVYKKLERGEELSDDEQMLWGSISLMNAVLTMLYPNPVTTTGFNVSRTVEGSYKRDKYEEKKDGNDNRTVINRTSVKGRTIGRTTTKREVVRR